jgi:D-alanine-D-alanine ligase
MKDKSRVMLLFGGQSAEHEVSVSSAVNVSRALRRAGYDLCLVYVSRRGFWHHVEDMDLLSDMGELEREGSFDIVVLTRGVEGVRLTRADTCKPLQVIDVAFPILHGPYGEDGTVQGLLKLLDLPFVGAGVTGSAVGMDKDIMNRLLRDGGVPIPAFLVFDESTRDRIDYERVIQELGSPLFVKPANLGSSVGIGVADDREAFQASVDRAFRFDRKIVIEECVRGREIECSVLGNERPVVSLPGEVVPRHRFYSYKAKYVDDRGADLVIPAVLDDATVRRVQELALRSFSVLCCEGLARVDLFVRENGEVLVNEINTLPGFTDISMYPKLWEASGIAQHELVDQLVHLALARAERERILQRERDRTE